MPLIHGYLNVYRSGWFHRAGKPNTFDRHAGDFYLTKVEALANVEPKSHYVDTVPVSWYEEEECCPNPAESTPIPLSVTRKEARHAHAA